MDWSSGEVRLEMKYAGNPSITIIQTSHNVCIWRKQLFMLLFRCCHSWTFPPSNFTIFHCPLSFCILHFAFFLTLSLPLLHCAPVSWHSIPMSDWAFVQLLLLGARWSTHFPFFQQEINPHSYHPAPSIITYELLCNSPAGVIVGTLRNSFYMSDFLRWIINREKKTDKWGYKCWFSGP